MVCAGRCDAIREKEAAPFMNHVLFVDDLRLRFESLKEGVEIGCGVELNGDPSKVRVIGLG